MLTQIEKKQVNEKVNEAKKFPCPSDLQPAIVKTFSDICDPFVGTIFVKRGKYEEGQLKDNCHKGVKQEIIKLV